MPNVLLDGCLMMVLVFSFNLRACVTECLPSVKASRRTLFLPEEGNISLHCDVQDCGKQWSGQWNLKRNFETKFAPLQASLRVHLANYNRTRLLVNIYNLSQSDSGEYKCMISIESFILQGHITNINVTTAERTQRKLSHRLLVCVGAILCLPLALSLACCLASVRLRAPQVPPRFSTSSTARVKPKAEVVYAAVVLKSPTETLCKSPEAREPTVYSSLNFSKV